MNTSIPENLTQYTFDFNALNAQPFERIAYEVTEFQDTSQKQCFKCKKVFPATTEFFHSDKSKKDGLTPYCKGCKHTIRHQKSEQYKESGYTAGGTKQCCKCEDIFPATSAYFVKDRHNKDGFRSQCKRCQGNSMHGIEPLQEGMKRCSKCHESLPATNAYFVTDNRHTDALYSSCKRCQGSKNYGVTPFKRGIRENEKQCTKCRLWKPFDDFGSNKMFSDALAAECKKCYNERITRKRTSSNSRDKWLRFKYGITGEEYDRMLEEQDGVCKICKREETHVDSKTKKVRPLVVDHDHTTGEVRALLCTACNTALGMMGEDPDRIRVLVEYAEWCKNREASLGVNHYEIGKVGTAP